jgi:uncharacterized protein
MIKLHKAGEEHCRELIAHGKVDDGPYTFDGQDRDALLGPKGTHVRMLAQVHLGEDDSLDEGEAKRYRYPCAKDGKVFSRALKSACDRAKEQGHEEVRASAEGLIGMLETGGGERSLPPAAPGGKGPSPDSEVRYLRGLEFRAAPAGSDSPGMIAGYAAVYNRLSEDLGGFREKIMPGAFRDVLKQDVRALANHSQFHLLGRTKAGTLRLKDSAHGLLDEIDLPSNQIGRDTAESVRRGDMDGQSFSFRVLPEDVQWDWDTTPPTRMIHRFEEIYDVGPVTTPAYTDTSVSMRTLESARAQCRCKAHASTSPDSVPFSLAKARQAAAEASLLPPTPSVS